MTTTEIPFEEILRAGGVVPTNGIDLRKKMKHVHRLYELTQENPTQAVIQILAAEQKMEQSQKECSNVMGAVHDLENILKGLLNSDALLCPLEGVREGTRPSTRETEGSDNEPPNGSVVPRAICRVNGQLRELAIHPDVDLDSLRNLDPWDYVSIHAKEMVVTGTHRDPDLFARAHGEVAEFKGYHDRERGLALVSRRGREEEIIQLSPELLDLDLDPNTRLILNRDDDRFAIGASAAEDTRGRFEVPVDGIETRLEDLAGIEDVIEPVLEDIYVRIVHPEVREKYALDPLRGMILYSYKPGMGKTAFMRALAVHLRELGAERDFNVVLHIVKPNALKCMWHGEDARLVREDLCGSIRARAERQHSRPLFQLVVLDEIESLGKRAGSDDGPGLVSSAQNDAVQALLVEMDGMTQTVAGDHHVLWVGLTNRPDLLDDALKRPGRFGDLILPMPEITIDGAESIMAIYARGANLPWRVGTAVKHGLSETMIRERYLRPALTTIFSAVVLRYATDQSPSVEVTAGQVLAGVHFMDAMNRAKRRAIRREIFGEGAPAIDAIDIAHGLVTEAASIARQLEADRGMLRRHLGLKITVNRVDPVDEASLEALTHNVPHLDDLDPNDDAEGSPRP